MILVVVLIAIAIQRFFKLNSYSRQINWALPYCDWMMAKAQLIKSRHGLISLISLILPIVFVTFVFFSVVHFLLGQVAAQVLQLVLLWYCLDARDLRKEPYPDSSTDTLLSNTYHHLFAVLFWYVVLGPVGLALYFSTYRLLAYFTELPSSACHKKEQLNDSIALNTYFVSLQRVLDWIPVRLLGLTFALMGSFRAVFKSWVKAMSLGLVDSQSLITQWGRAALQLGSRPAKEDNQSQKASLDSVIDLVDRSLLVWLVVIFLVTVGFIVS